MMHLSKSIEFERWNFKKPRAEGSIPSAPQKSCKQKRLQGFFVLFK
jgi:hypothetical protein